MHDTVSIDGRQDHVVKTPFGNCFGGVRRFRWVEGEGSSRRLDRTEPAPSRTRIAHQHYGCRGNVVLPATPTFSDVWTACLFADLKRHTTMQRLTSWQQRFLKIVHNVYMQFNLCAKLCCHLRQCFQYRASE